jgi:type II secretory pathway component PulJ
MIKNKRGFTLSELVVGLSVIATITLVISAMLFSGFSMTGKNSEDIYMGTYFKKEYNQLRKEIKEANVVCIHNASSFTDDNNIMCGNPSADPQLENNKIIYLLNSNNEEIYYKFENNQLRRNNITTSTNEIYIKNVDGSFEYSIKNLISLDLSFKDKENNPMLEFSQFYISINQ